RLFGSQIESLLPFRHTAPPHLPWFLTSSLSYNPSAPSSQTDRRPALPIFLSPPLNLRRSRPFLLMSGPKAVARLSQGIRPSTALRRFSCRGLWRNLFVSPRIPHRQRH